MKYCLLLSFLGFLLSACTGDGATAQAAGPVVGKVDPRAPLRQDPADKDLDAPGLVFRMGEARAGKGEIACLPVEVSGFQNILGFQYTVRFDSAALKYHSIRNLNLENYNVQTSFGTRFADRGVLSTLWMAKDITTGTTVADGRRAYEVCFENLQPKGQETEVKFQNGPTFFEVIGTGGQKWRLVHANGRVISR